MKGTRPILLVACLLATAFAGDSDLRKVVQRNDPEYPDIAAKMSLRGTVRLRAYIAPDGSVRRVEYIGGHPLLAESAVKSVKTWRFEPAAKETSEIVEVRF